MFLATEESKKSDSKTSQPRLNWGLRFIIAAAGAAISFWLASLQNVHKLPSLPTFHDRLMQVAPTLLEGALGLIFLIWVGLLFREAGIRSTPKLVSNPSAAETAKKKSWTAVKWVLFAVFILATVPSLGGNYFKYLWPGYPEWISHAARPVFDVLGALGAIVASTRRRRSQKPQPGTGYGEEKGPWLDDRQQTFIAVALIGIAVIFGIHHFFARNLPPASQLRVTAISALILVLILVALSKTNRKTEQYAAQSEIQQQSLVPAVGRQRRLSSANKTRLFWIAILVFTFTVVSLPVPKEFKQLAIFGPWVILILGAVVLTKLKRGVFMLSMQGKFDEALQQDRRLSSIPGYGRSLAGVIHFNAGRYPEAQAFTKPFAFDEQGQPKLTSMELYTYAIALENDGKEAEAEKLLEAATQVPQRMSGFHVALATCLLSQKKDAARACQLLEQAMAFPEPRASGYGRTSDDMKRLGRYAWALAAAGRRAEAEGKIREAFAGSTSLKDRDLAGVHYFVGEAWRSMGDWKKARAAFEEAMRLSPDGPAATGTQKALAKMRVEAQD